MSEDRKDERIPRDLPDQLVGGLSEGDPWDVDAAEADSGGGADEAAADREAGGTADGSAEADGGADRNGPAAAREGADGARTDAGRTPRGTGTGPGTDAAAKPEEPAD